MASSNGRHFRNLEAPSLKSSQSTTRTSPGPTSKNQTVRKTTHASKNQKISKKIKSSSTKASSASPKQFQLQYHVINSIAVLPEYQGKGRGALPSIGGSLMKHLIHERVAKIETGSGMQNNGHTQEGPRKGPKLKNKLRKLNPDMTRFAKVCRRRNLELADSTKLKDVRQIRLETNQIWTNVIEFYERLGFHQTGLTWPKYYWNKDIRKHSKAVRMEMNVEVW